MLDPVLGSSLDSINKSVPVSYIIMDLTIDVYVTKGSSMTVAKFPRRNTGYRVVVVDKAEVAIFKFAVEGAGKFIVSSPGLTEVVHASHVLTVCKKMAYGYGCQRGLPALHAQ